MRLLTLLAIFAAFYAHSGWSRTTNLPSTVAGGFGLTQTESFWAERAPIHERWFLLVEQQSPWVLGANTPWQSPVRVGMGLHGHLGSEKGTLDFGEERLGGMLELIAAAGPSLNGSLFSLGGEWVSSLRVGVDRTVTRAIDVEDEFFTFYGGVGTGPGAWVAWNKLVLRERLLLGYGSNGFQHELRLELGFTF